MGRCGLAFKTTISWLFMKACAVRKLLLSQLLSCVFTVAGQAGHYMKLLVRKLVVHYGYYTWSPLSMVDRRMCHHPAAGWLHPADARTVGGSSRVFFFSLKRGGLREGYLSWKMVHFVLLYCSCPHADGGHSSNICIWLPSWFFTQLSASPKESDEMLM